jgi:hypothetical protein
MALILCFVNKSALAEISDYNVEVLVGDGTSKGSYTITKGKVKGHRRSEGWKVLVQQFLDQQVVEDKRT